MLRPVVPVNAGELNHISRVMIPFVTESTFLQPWFSDSTLFDLVEFSEDWSRLEIGPVLPWPTGGREGGPELSPTDPAIRSTFGQSGTHFGVFNQNLEMKFSRSHCELSRSSHLPLGIKLAMLERFGNLPVQLNLEDTLRFTLIHLFPRWGRHRMFPGGTLTRFSTPIMFALVGAILTPSAALAQASALNRSVRTSESSEPAIPRPEQDRAAAAKLSALAEKTGRKPNVLLIVVDDMGYGDPGCYGGGTAIGAATPNMDRLAREGLRLTSCYSQHTCTPTRATINTGRLPVRSGLTRPILAGDKIKTNPWEGEVSLPTIMSGAGYTTLLTGKWHLGEGVGMRPHDVGFDEFYGYYPAEKEISQYIDKRRYPDLVLDEEKFEAFKKSSPSHKLIHGFKGGQTDEVGSIESLEDMARADQQLADFTVKKIHELARGEKPFLIEHCFMKVHADNFANPDHEGLSASKYPYKDGIVEVDLHIGAFVKALEEAGIDENTFVFVTSDNGPQMDAWPDGGYTPFRGAKGTTFDGGVRVPGIAYWRGMIAPGRESDELFDLTDLFNTSIHLAGATGDIPTDRYIDGIDQASFLLHDEGRSKREIVHMWWQTQYMGLRMREYKLHLKVVLPQSPHMYIDMSTIQNVGLAPWLFNLYIDPKEEMTVGHRMNPWLAALGAEAKAHGATFKKYPMKDIGLGQ